VLTRMEAGVGWQQKPVATIRAGPQQVIAAFLEDEATGSNWGGDWHKSLSSAPKFSVVSYA
jgi:hypothetical protein